MTILVTGGAGFIGSNFIVDWFNCTKEKLINIDKLTYASNLNNTDYLKNDHDYLFLKGDIGDKELVENILDTYKPRAIINFAAESHVDNSISDPEIFIKTNIVSTFHLLQTTLKYWSKLPTNFSIENEVTKDKFRFLHISTDEVYGSLNENDPAFTENTKYEPNSPYSASKASSDHLVRAYNSTYGLPSIITNCSNNYGPYQFKEKLIPLTIHNALHGKEIPIYGNGKQIRDWLYVSDHCDALRLILESGTIGEKYNIGGGNELTNIYVVNIVCDILEKIIAESGYSLKHEKKFKDLIKYVDDRLGHDTRYAIDYRKIEKDLGWKPVNNFLSGIEKTISWYVKNIVF